MDKRYEAAVAAACAARDKAVESLDAVTGSSLSRLLLMFLLLTLLVFLCGSLTYFINLSMFF